MIIPLSTDQRFRRRPVVNETLIALNLLIFLFSALGAMAGWWSQSALAEWGAFNPRDMRPWQLITYQFMHDPYGFGHVIFNMLFLWVFGNAVEGRLGPYKYLGFYLMAGCLAAIAHSVATGSPVIGASGSVAGVSGAFLALFPHSRVRIFYFFFIIGIAWIPALWLIGFFVVLDLLRQTLELFGAGAGRVAYAAHLAGYMFGFLFAVVLLATGLLKREDTDVFFLFKQSQRRRQFRRVSQSNPGVWDAPQKSDLNREKQSGKLAEKTSDPQTEAYAKARSEISRLVAAHDLPAAAKKYRELVRNWPEAVLPESKQLDIANQLYAESAHTDAAGAYERYLAQYPRASDRRDVRLLLATIHLRHLHNTDRARELLDSAAAEARDESARQLIDQLRTELGE